KGVKAEGFELRGDDERKRGERDDQRLEDGHAFENVDVWTETEEEDAERAGEGRGGGAKCTGGALQQDVEREEREAEDAECESARSDGRDPGELEDDELEHGPDGKRDGGVEVARPVPVASEVVADGGVGVLGPVHPGRVVGEVRSEMEKVKRKEDRCHGEQKQAGQISKHSAFVMSTARHRLQCN